MTDVVEPLAGRMNLVDLIHKDAVESLPITLLQTSIK